MEKGGRDEEYCGKKTSNKQNSKIPKVKKRSAVVFN